MHGMKTGGQWGIKFGFKYLLESNNSHYIVKIIRIYWVEIMRCALIVEDEPQIRTLVGIVLEAAGYGVLEAANGMDALDIIRKRLEPFDLIILDIRMPQMDGFEFLYRLRRHERSLTPVLVLTAHEDACEKARDYGADGCLSKPFDRKQLIETINHLVTSPIM